MRCAAELHARPTPPPSVRHTCRVRCQAAASPLWGRTNGDVVNALACRALAGASAASQRYLVGVAGCPGSGKSTTVAAVVARVNELAGAEVAVALPMDGFHLSRSQLDALPNAAEAHARRGAPWTFDAEAFVDAVRRARFAQGVTTLLPSFDHAARDPVPDSVALRPSHRVVLVEGNYVGLPSAPWNGLRALLDEQWVMDVPPQVAMRRIVHRHMSVWGLSFDEATARARSNDEMNAHLVWGSSRDTADLLVPSYENVSE